MQKNVIHLKCFEATKMDMALGLDAPIIFIGHDPPFRESHIPSSHTALERACIATLRRRRHLSFKYLSTAGNHEIHLYAYI